MRLIRLFLLLIIFSPLELYASDIPQEHRWSKSEKLLLNSLSIDNVNLDFDSSNRVVSQADAVTFGHQLFFEKRFSQNGKISCASCHHPDKYFTDGLAVAEGIEKTSRNAPTIVGSSLSTWFFHDGRADSLWSQALGPLENELEHGANRSLVAHTIFNDSILKKQYEKLFGKMPNIKNITRFPLNAGPVKNKQANQVWKKMSKSDKKIITDIFVNVAKAIAAYETELQPAASRFDFYLRALKKNSIKEMQKQLSIPEVKGLRVFVSKAKCVICHSGPMLTDNGFHNISVPPRKLPSGKSLKHDWGRYKGAQQVLKSKFNCRSRYNDTPRTGSANACDELEYIVMGRHETQGSMKTPSLRNVAKTAPYMHAGQFENLQEVIEHYDNPPAVTFRRSELFLNFDLSKQDIANLEAFLKSLNSPINAPSKLLVAPK